MKSILYFLAPGTGAPVVSYSGISKRSKWTNWAKEYKVVHEDGFCLEVTIREGKRFKNYKYG